MCQTLFLIFYVFICSITFDFHELLQKKNYISLKFVVGLHQNFLYFMGIQSILLYEAFFAEKYRANPIEPYRVFIIYSVELSQITARVLLMPEKKQHHSDWVFEYFSHLNLVLFIWKFDIFFMSHTWKSVSCFFLLLSQREDTF